MLISQNENVGYRKIYMVNGAIMTVSILFAILMPSIGKIISYTGALCGAVVVFILPSFVFLASARKERKLTTLNVFMHLFIICLGIINFCAQFF
jgi:amino acid permease